MLSQFDASNLSKLCQIYHLSHLAPPSSISQKVLPCSHSLIYLESEHFLEMKGKRIRKIFYNVAYTEQEQNKIQEVEFRMNKEHIPQRFFPRQTILKHLYDADMKTGDCTVRLTKTYGFLTNPEVSSFRDTTRQRLERGEIYTYGRDKSGNPIVILQMQHFDFLQPLDTNFNHIYFLMLVVLGIRTAPGNAQKYNCIFDFSGVSITSIPFRDLRAILENLSLVYCGCVERTFLFNTSGIQTVWKFLKRFVPEHARNSIFFLDQTQNSKFLEFISPEELQEKYGGVLPNLDQYWPPSFTSTPDEKMNFPTQFQGEDYYSVKGHSDDESSYFTMGSPRKVKKITEPIYEKQQEKVHCKCRLF